MNNVDERYFTTFLETYSINWRRVQRASNARGARAPAPAGVVTVRRLFSQPVPVRRGEPYDRSINEPGSLEGHDAARNLNL